MIISDDMMAKLVAKAKELIDNHYDDIRGINIWDVVMINDTDGYDINVYQWDENEPIVTIAYLVKDNEIVNDYVECQDITDEVNK
jgi:hypothetical protein